MHINITPAEQKIVQRAMRIMEKSLRYEATTLNAPADTRDFLKLRFLGQDVEQFVGLMLDSQHRLIEAVTLATGTIDAAAVYPREVVKQAISLGASAIIFAHNHPSGMAEPSSADRMLTDRLKQACALVDVRVLDHIVVGGTSTVSFAERGWI